MAAPFLGEIRIFTFNFPPRGWALCNGQLLPINQNQALFSLLGTMYGGNGQTNFALPNLRGRMPFHVGNGFTQGQSAGAETHTLTTAEMPTHTHTVWGNQNAADRSSPVNGIWAAQELNPFGSTPSTTMNFTAVTVTGGGQPHTNMPPYLVLNFCIALQGFFPSRN